MTIQQMLFSVGDGDAPTGTYGTYSFYGYFSGSGASSTPAQAYVQWLTNFENSNNVTQMTMSFSNYGTYYINDVNYINGLRTALSTGQNYGTGATNNWYLGWGCGSGTGGYNFIRGGNGSPTFVIGATNSCACSYTQIRPLLSNGNWGGYNGGCSQGGQYMGMGFTGYV